MIADSDRDMGVSPRLHRVGHIHSQPVKKANSSPRYHGHSDVICGIQSAESSIVEGQDPVLSKRPLSIDWWEWYFGLQFGTADKPVPGRITGCTLNGIAVFSATAVRRAGEQGCSGENAYQRLESDSNRRTTTAPGESVREG